MNKDPLAQQDCLVSTDNKEGTESMVKMVPREKEVLWELLVKMVFQVYKENLVSGVILAVMVKIVLASKVNRENGVNPVMLVKSVSQGDKVKRVNLQRKCLLSDKRENEAFQEWLAYLAVPEHLEMKAK